MLAQVQGHCLAKHPSKPIRYRRCDEEDQQQQHEEEDSSEMAATGALADVKIESVESLAFGEQDFFAAMPDNSSSGHVTSDGGSHVGRSTHWSDASGGNYLFFFANVAFLEPVSSTPQKSERIFNETLT